MQCSKCGTQNKDGFRYCGTCGTPLEKPRVQTITCPNCGYANEVNSKFCQECASPLKLTFAAQEPQRAAPPIVVEQAGAISSEGITIEFPYSTASTFDFALGAAQRFATFQQIGENKKALYRVTFALNEVESATDLLEHLKGWKRRAVFLNGEKTTWDSVFAFDWCYATKKASFKPQFYCFGYENDYQLNPWGCIHAGLAFVEHAQWFCWGRWANKNGDWEFDKERMRHELQKNLYPFRFCPAINLARVEDVLSALPDRVNPSKDKNWKFIESYDDATPGLRMVINRGGFQDKVVMVGVSPNGVGALKEISRQMNLRLSDRLGV